MALNLQAVRGRTLVDVRIEDLKLRLPWADL
jgi:hypothetical protein